MDIHVYKQRIKNHLSIPAVAMAPSLSGTDATDEKLVRVRHSQHTPLISLSVKPG